jgi:hypothetical protein
MAANEFRVPEIEEPPGQGEQLRPKIVKIGKFQIEEQAVTILTWASIASTILVMTLDIALIATVPTV